MSSPCWFTSDCFLSVLKAYKRYSSIKTRKLQGCSSSSLETMKSYAMQFSSSTLKSTFTLFWCSPTPELDYIVPYMLSARLMWGVQHNRVSRQIYGRAVALDFTGVPNKVSAECNKAFIVAYTPLFTLQSLLNSKLKKYQFVFCFLFCFFVTFLKEGSHICGVEFFRAKFPLLL